MNRLSCWTLVAVVSAGSAGCSDDGANPDGGANPNRNCRLYGCWEEDQCIGGSLESYCKGTCRTYEEALAEADELEAPEPLCTDDGLLRRRFTGVGTCDDLWWVRIQPELSADTEFFDASGTMVAAEHATDCDCFCDNRSFSISFGPVPDCTRERLIETCDGA